MGQRSDDLETTNDDYSTPFERSQEEAGRNEELMRENLSSSRSIPEDSPEELMRENLSSTRYVADDTPDMTGVSSTEYIVEDAGVPISSPGAEAVRDSMSGIDAGADFDAGARNTAGDEDTAEIRSNIEDTRSRMGSTIDAIQEKLSPRNLVDQAKEAARDATIGRAQEMAGNVADMAKEGGSTLMDTIRANPIPVALTAVGLGWLVFGARREANRRHEREYWDRGYGRYRDRGWYPGYPGSYGPYQQPQQDQGRMGQMTDRMQHAAGKVGDRVQDAASNVGDRMQDAAGTVADKAGDMADYAQWQAQRTRSWFEQTWNDNPLLVAGAALALGTVVGLVIPETEVEDKLMGETRDSLVQKAQGVAQDTVRKAQDAATDATDQVKQQARTARGATTNH